MPDFNLRTKMIDDCMEMKIYLSNWGFYKRLKLQVNDKETPLSEILFPLLSDEDLYNVYAKMKRISSQPMA